MKISVKKGFLDAFVSTPVKIAIYSIVYGILSISMVIINKLIVSSDRKNPNITPENLVIVQCAVSALCILVIALFTGAPIKISFNNFLLCILINLAFVMVTLSNSYTLKYLSIHMVTLLKCTSLFVTAIGDKFILHQNINLMSWVSLFLIVIGSSCGVATDLEFNLIGYIWMAISIIAATVYVILTKIFISHLNLHYFTASFWNNAISTVILCIGSIVRNYKNPNILAVFTGLKTTKYHSNYFIIFSGVIGLMLNLSTYSLLGETSATSYVVVGVSKKIIQAIISYLFFDKLTSVWNIISVMIGLSGSCMYATVKFYDQKQSRRKSVLGTPLEPDDEELLVLNENISDDLE